MYTRLQIGNEYTLDTMLKKMGRPTPVSYDEHTVIFDLEDGIYYILELVKDSIISYPVFYKVLQAGAWDKAIQILLLNNSN